MLFGRYWLHEATQRALEARASRESREQTLFGGFFAGQLAMLPKRFNVEMRFWDSTHAKWRDEQRRLHGDEAVPLDIMTDGSDAGASSANGGGTGGPQHAAILHYVGRDKPWMRYDRSSAADSKEDLCRRLREKDVETCARYLATQAMWWQTFAEGRCLLVGDAARGKKQGFVVDSFELVLRMHHKSLPPSDVGNASRAGNRLCADGAGCARAAAAAGCRGEGALLSLGRERELPPGTRSLLHDVYRPKLGVFGGPKAVAQS